MANSCVVGRCLNMCPHKEIVRREKARRLHRFEIAQGTEKANFPKADPKLCVKEFTRAAAGQINPNPIDIRPPSVLKRTVGYLFENILCLKAERESWNVLYDFVFDRMRAIRQDLVFQNVWNADSIYILECSVRFHLYSIFRLCAEPLSIFDPHINESHLQECLKRLLVLYQDDDFSSSPRRAEMESYYILFNLGSAEALRHTLTLPKSLLISTTVAAAFKINLALLHCNFHRTFRLISGLSFLNCAAVMHHIPLLRRTALNVMSNGYSAQNNRFPLQLLKQWLLLGSITETRNVCTHYGVKTDEEFAYFQKLAFKSGADVMKLYQYEFVSDKHNDLNILETLQGNGKL